MYKPPIKDYFTFNKRERRATLFLVGILLVTIALNFFSLESSTSVSENENFDSMVDVFYASEEKANRKFFYEEKENCFRKNSYKPHEKSDSHKRNKPLTILLNLNQSDSADWTSLNGIGPIYAARIVKYRDMLGGFSSKEQLKEVYGIDEELFSKLENRIQLDKAELRRININTADYQFLAQHPYIKPSLAKQLVNYRAQHGNFNSLDHLFEFHQMDSLTFNKLKPYLSL